jgi:hypothetical protein
VKMILVRRNEWAGGMAGKWTDGRSDESWWR